MQMEEENEHNNDERLRISIPAIDLRNFCQDELLLAAELSGHFPEACFPNPIIPALDKNFFHRSLASGKQTYRRRPRRSSAQSPASTFSAQTVSHRQSKPLPLKYKARLLLECKKAKQILKENSKKKLKSHCNGLSTDTTSVAGAIMLGNRSLKCTSLKERSRKSVAVTESQLESSRPTENRPSETTNQSQDEALQPVSKRFKLKEGARNRAMFKRQGGYATLQGSGCLGAANSQQLPKSDLMDQTLAFSQGLQHPKRGLDAALQESFGGCKKEVTGLDGVGGETGTLDYPSRASKSRKMTKKTVMARACSTNLEFTIGFKRPNKLDELEFSNHERRDLHCTSHLV